MHSVTLLWLPIAALAVLAGVGLAATTALASGRPADVRAALAPCVGAAILACSSALLILGAPAKAALACVVVLSILPLRAVRRRLAVGIHPIRGPIVVAGVVLLVMSLPWMAMRSWEPAAYQNADSYIWVSQAK